MESIHDISPRTTIISAYEGRLKMDVGKKGKKIKILKNALKK